MRLQLNLNIILEYIKRQPFFFDKSDNILLNVFLEIVKITASSPYKLSFLYSIKLNKLYEP
jgi:hypothetical protein